MFTMKVAVAVVLCAAVAVAYGGVLGDLKRLEQKVQCGLCVKVVGIVDKLVDGDEAMIQNFLDSTCDKLGYLTEKCHQLVDNNLKNILDLLASDKTVKEICTVLGQCDPNTPPPAL